MGELHVAEEPAVPASVPPAPVGDDDFEARWAEAEASILRAQAEQRERAERAAAARGGTPEVTRVERVERTGDTRARPKVTTSAQASAKEGSAVSETGSGSSESSASKEAPPAPKRRFASFNAIRARIATVIWMVAVFAALALAVGALCVALKVDFSNSALNGLASLCDMLDFGSFKTFAGEMKLDTFLAKLDSVKPNDYPVKTVLMSWGAAAVIWLVVGKILDKLLRP